MSPAWPRCRAREGSAPRPTSARRLRRTRSASRRAEADDEFRRACQGCCVTRPARRAPSPPPFRTGSRALPVPGRLCLAGPSPAAARRTPSLPCRLILRGARPGRRTDEGHGERRRQVSAELLAPGPRAGRAGPGVLPLSAGRLCVRVSGPDHPPLGPGQVSAASPAPPPPWAVLQAPSRGWEE